MKLFILINKGLERAAQQETKELIQVENYFYPHVLETDVENHSKIISLIHHSQSSRRILAAITKTKNIEMFTLPSNFPWSGFFNSNISFKVEIEGVKGQENRFEIARNVAGKIFKILEDQKISPTLELKKPQTLLIVYFNGQDYFLGMDIAGFELNSRSYRVFPHQASFKGDFAYYVMRKSGFKAGEKLLVAMCKDGVIPIEAAIFAQRLPFQASRSFSSQYYYSFKDTKTTVMPSPEKFTKIDAFDETLPNVIAARKNAKLARVYEFIDFQKYSLEDLDVKYDEQSFDRIIFHITSKDENKINEIYYQSSYLLKPKGTLLLLGRKDWDLSISQKFNVIEEEEIQKGESVHKIWVLEKK